MRQMVETTNFYPEKNRKNHFINLSKFKILKGDCREVLKTLESNSVHFTLTDPPYFLDGLDSDWKKGRKEAIKGTGSVGGLPIGMKFDPRQGYALQSFITQVGEELIRVMTPGAFAIFFSQPRLAHRMASGLEDSGFEIRDVYAWHFKKAQCKAFGMDHFINKMSCSLEQKMQIKRCLQGRKTAQLRPQFETMILAQKPKEGTYIENWLKYRTGLMDSTIRIDDKTPSTLMSFEKPSRQMNNHHLTVKPTDLLEHLINIFSVPHQVVLDPFLGSGSTMLAAKATDRLCIGIEINPEYIDIAHQRLMEYL